MVVVRWAVGRRVQALQGVLASCALLVASLGIGACGDDCDGRHPIGSSPLTITVIDADTGDTICDADITVEHEGVSTELTPRCSSAAGTGPGTYRISARRTGYAEKAIEVSVSRDECSDIVTERVTIELTPV